MKKPNDIKKELIIFTIIQFFLDEEDREFIKEYSDTSVQAMAERRNVSENQIRLKLTKISHRIQAIIHDQATTR